MLQFQEKCPVCEAEFSNAGLYSHAAGHGIESDSAEWEDYFQNVVCPLDLRDCLEIFAEKLRQAYLSLRLHMIINGFPVDMMPTLETERSVNM